MGAYVASQREVHNGGFAKFLGAFDYQIYAAEDLLVVKIAAADYDICVGSYTVIRNCTGLHAVLAILAVAALHIVGAGDDAEHVSAVGGGVVFGVKGRHCVGGSVGKVFATVACHIY